MVISPNSKRCVQILGVQRRAASSPPRTGRRSATRAGHCHQRSSGVSTRPKPASGKSLGVSAYSCWADTKLYELQNFAVLPSGKVVRWSGRLPQDEAAWECFQIPRDGLACPSWVCNSPLTPGKSGFTVINNR